MKITISILLFFLTLNGSADNYILNSENTSNTYYIDPIVGNDTTGNGYFWKPYRTLYKACTIVTTSGSIIHLNTGIFNEYHQSLLAVGVSIEGEGRTSVISSHISEAYTPTILALSNILGTNGNQHISNLSFDGNNTLAYEAIFICSRSNVSIYNCFFTNFLRDAIRFVGQSRFVDGEPSTYAKGNSFHDNIVLNCSSFVWNGKGDPGSGSGFGALCIGGQKDMLIYNNSITQPVSRGSHLDGTAIESSNAGYCKGIKIYNNILSKPDFDGVTWDFAIETLNSTGGWEIYNNTITGSIDMAFRQAVQDVSYPYSCWIHNNIIGRPTLGQYESVRGVILEGDIANVIIENNYIHDVAAGIYFSGSMTKKVNNVRISYNIMNNIGVNDNGNNYKGWGVLFPSHNSITTSTTNHINIYNNTIISHVGTKSTMYGIGIPRTGTIKNINIKDNIVKDFQHYPTFTEMSDVGTTIDSLILDNNCFYNNSSNMPFFSKITPTHYFYNGKQIY